MLCSFGKMFLLFSLLYLRLTVVSTAAAGACEKTYPLEDLNLESQGIYTGYRDPDKMLVFEVTDQSVLTVVKHEGSNETTTQRKTMTLRDDCPMTEKALSPTLTDLLKENGDVCFTGPSQGTWDVNLLLEKKFMAVWTFSVPAKQCFALKFLIRILSGQGNYDSDRLFILDGDLTIPVAIKSGVPEYELPLRNDTTSVSIVYYYTSLSGFKVYWRAAPSLKTSDCLC